MAVADQAHGFHGHDRPADERLQEFAALVNAMRKAQRMYFKSRDRSALAEAMRLEREVDKAVVDILSRWEMP